MRIPLLSGRGFTAQDTANSPGVVVVNEAFANQYFKNQNPIGKHLRFASAYQTRQSKSSASSATFITSR